MLQCFYRAPVLTNLVVDVESKNHCRLHFLPEMVISLPYLMSLVLSEATHRRRELSELASQDHNQVVRELVFLFSLLFPEDGSGFVGAAIGAGLAARDGTDTKRGRRPIAPAKIKA